MEQQIQQLNFALGQKNSGQEYVGYIRELEEKIRQMEQEIQQLNFALEQKNKAQQKYVSQINKL